MMLLKAAGAWIYLNLEINWRIIVHVHNFKTSGSMKKECVGNTENFRYSQHCAEIHPKQVEIKKVFDVKVNSKKVSSFRSLFL